MFPNRTRLGPKGRIRRQADFGTTSSVVPKGMILETPTALQKIAASMLSAIQSVTARLVKE